MVKNLSVEFLGLCFLKHYFKELPWKGFVPYQGLSGISIDLDTVRLHMYLYFGTINTYIIFELSGCILSADIKLFLFFGGVAIG